MANLVPLVFLLLVSFSCSLREVCIVPELYGGNPEPPAFCKIISSLNRFCQEASDVPDHTTVTLLSGTHYLNTTCQFKNVENITVRGETGSGVTVRCSPGKVSGFQYLNVSKLVMTSIELIGCGAAWKIPQSIILKFPNSININLFSFVWAGLMVINGKDHTLNKVTVYYSGIIIHDAAGTVAMDSIEVESSSSSGILILHDANVIGKSRLTIADSLVHFNDLIELAGLSVILDTSNLTIDIARTTFSHNYGGPIGGNMAVFFFNSTASVTVSESSFFSGYASGWGGGIRVYFDLKLKSSLCISNSTFANNEAGNGGGGGVSVQGAPGSASLDIEIVESSFHKNTAGSGSALHTGLYSLPSDFRLNPVDTCAVNLKISACIFSNNDYYYGEYYRRPSVIGLYHALFVKMDGIIVEFNNMMAIMAETSNLEFSNTSRISSNTGLSGVGLTLSNSRLLFKPNTDLLITNNSALTTGGGVQYSDNDIDIKLNSHCFYGFNISLAKTINFTIIGNYAQKGGANYYGLGGMKYCTLHIPYNDIGKSSSISSSPQGVNFFIAKHFIYPGEKVSFIDVSLIGYLGGLTTGAVSASIKGGYASIKDSEKILQEIGIAGKTVTYTIYKTSTNNSEREFELGFKAIGGVADKHVGMTFLDCPFGFPLTTNTGNSECQILSIPVIVNHSLESQTITKRNFSWLGMFEMDNQSHMAANDYCPLDYCNPTIHEIRTYPDQLDQDEQCQYNRTGVLCGACPENLSLVLGNSECHKCSSVWLLLILPFALAGLLLVVLIHFLDLTVTTGTVCGLIFYANILQDHSVALLSKYHPIPGLTPFLQVFLSWVNLDLGISTCFYDGMEAFGKTMLLFVFPIYIWSISAAIIILSNRFIRFTRLMGNTAMKLLSTLIILSYSKMLRVSIGIFDFKLLTVYDMTNSSISDTVARWAVDGNISYLNDRKHLVLFLIAVLFVLLLLPFSFTLLCIKHVYYLSNCGQVFSWVDKLKPFFETYTGPFNDKARFWTGLLLFVRLFLLIVGTVDYGNSIAPFYIITATCFLLLVIMVILQGVYKTSIPNVLETFFIFNICIIFLINTYDVGSELWTSIVSNLLVTSAFLAFLGIVAYHVCLKFGFTKCPCFQPQNAEADYEEFDYEGMRGEHEYRPLLEQTN